MAQHDHGTCEHCGLGFGYSLFHSGFADIAYAYCDSCGWLATLSAWDPAMQKLPMPVGWQQEISACVEPLLQPCSCGGHFRKGASPRCPHCFLPLSAEIAAVYIEKNAPGTAKGWRWQKSWNGVYCIAIEDPEKPETLRSGKAALVPGFQNELP